MSQWTYTLDPNYGTARVEDQGRSRRVRYQVTTNRKDLTEAEIQQDSGYTWGQSDPEDPSRFLRSIEVNHDGTNPYYWELILEYRSETLEGYTADQSQIPPLQRPPEFDWSFEEVSELVDVDIHGNPLVTKNGEPFDPPVQRPFADLVGRVTFYSIAWDAVTMLALVNKVNADTWYGWAPGTVMFCAPTARSVVEFPWDPCYQITYVFKCRVTGWQPRVLHAGYKAWTGAYDDAGLRVVEAIKSNDGTPVETPRPLDDDGRLIPLLPDGRLAAPPTWLTFDLYESVSFAGLGV